VINLTDTLAPDRAATSRQVEILCLLSSGLTSRDVAQRLSISEHTVVRHISNMMCLFEAKNRLELLGLAVACGIVDSTCWPLRPSGMLSLGDLDVIRSTDSSE
jgi:DNA-binding CsgD family transcriptional regulator